jgi:hypothetical protein
MKIYCFVEKSHCHFDRSPDNHRDEVEKSIQKQTCPEPSREISRLAFGSLEVTFQTLFNRAKIYVTWALLICTVACAFSASAFADVQVYAQVDTSQDIYVGESFAYMIIIDGENKPGEVDLAPLMQYHPQSVGNRDVSQTSISIINGRTTRNVTKRYVMSYSLTADKPGTIQLPPVTVTIDGKEYLTNPVTVNVLRPGTTDQLDLEVTLSEQTCYVGQPIIMTVNFYISADIGDFQFKIPVFSSDDFYIEDPDSRPPQAKQYRLHSGVTAFISQNRIVHKGRDAILLSFSKVLIPKYPGQIDIAAASVSADVAVGLARSHDSLFDDFGFFGSRKQYKRFMVSSESLSLTVLPLPEQDKPPQYYGLVGRYAISALATPTKINVGDPITLTIKIGGEFLKPVRWPELEEIPEMATNFKIPSQKASPAIENGYKIFTQTIRANNDNVTEIPPIPLALFDPDKGEYLVAKTDPIKLEVAPTKVLTNADMQGMDSVPINKEVEAIKKGLSANYEGADVLMNQTFSPLAALTSPGYAVVWSVPLAGFVLSVIIKLLTHTSPERQAVRRKRQASKNAVRQLKNIASTEQGRQHELIASAMRVYIGERFGKSAGALTADDCRDIIATFTGDAQIANKYADIIANCEAARYAPMAANVNAETINEVIELIRLIEKKSK